MTEALKMIQKNADATVMLLGMEDGSKRYTRCLVDHVRAREYDVERLTADLVAEFQRAALAEG